MERGKWGLVGSGLVWDMVPSITIGWDIHGSFGLVTGDVHGQMVILEESMSWTFSVNGVFPCSFLKPFFPAHFLNLYTYLHWGYFSSVSLLIPGSGLRRNPRDPIKSHQRLRISCPSVNKSCDTRAKT